MSYDFVKQRNKFFVISSLLIGIGLIILEIFGLNLGVDFEGGTRVEILIEESFSTTELGKLLNDKGFTPREIGIAGNNKEIAALVFIGTLTTQEINQIETIVEESYGEITVIVSTVSPEIARELAKQAIFAVMLASIGIVIYVTVRFEYKFAIAAIIALAHDVLFVIAMFSLLRLELDLTFIAAILTVVGYSINDTIIIFDRLRENVNVLKINNQMDLAKAVNQSIISTLPRSINTSLTVLFAAVALYLFGGEAIRNFSFTLIMGLLVGAYSSIFIAAQTYFIWKSKDMKKKPRQLV